MGTDVRCGVVRGGDGGTKQTGVKYRHADGEGEKWPRERV